MPPLSTNDLRPGFALRLHVLLLLPIAVLMGLGTLANYHGVWRQDQYQVINLGQVVHDGGRLYIDCWENKPPGVPWMIAAVLWAFGGSLDCAWWFPGFLGFAGLAVFGWALRANFGWGVSLAVSILAAVMFSMRAYDAPSNHPDFHAAMFVMIGTSLFLFPSTRNGSAGALLSVTAGAAWGWGVVCRQTALAGPFILMIAAWFEARRNPQAAAEFRKTAVHVVLAGVAVFAGVLAVLWRQETLREMFDAVFVFNRQLLSRDHWVDSATALLKLVPMLYPLQLPLLGAIISVWRAAGKSSSGLGRTCVAAMTTWFVVENWLALLGPSQIDRYWQATWTPMLWLAADGLNQLVQIWRGWSRPLQVRRGVLTLAILVLLMVPLIDRYVQGRHQDGLIRSSTQYFMRHTLPTERSNLEGIGRRAQELVAREEKMYVLNYDPGIYLFARRASAVRFTYPRGADQQEEMLRVLESNPPGLILLPVAADPDEAWRMSADRVGRLQQILGGYRGLGVHLGYQFMLRADIPEGDRTMPP